MKLRRAQGLGEAELNGLAELLIDAVEGGASVGFLHPLSLEKALGFWRGIGSTLARGERALLLAEDAHGIAGSVQLVLAQPENQPHRADLAKMLVHRRARRQGLGAALMAEAEATARQHGKTLLVLDTATPEAERLYRRAGWQFCGEIPGFALLPDPAQGLCATRLYFKALAPG